MRSEPQVSNHESADAKDAFIDVTSPAGAAWKQRPGRGVQVGTQVETGTAELCPCQTAAKPALFLCVRDSHRCICHSALILPTAGQESPACLIRCLVSQITGLMLSEHRCATCQTHKIIKQLISYMWGFAPLLLQVTWLSLQCSSSIFSYFPTSVRKRGI